MIKQQRPTDDDEDDETEEVITRGEDEIYRDNTYFSQNHPSLCTNNNAHKIEKEKKNKQLIGRECVRI